MFLILKAEQILDFKNVLNGVFQEYFLMSQTCGTLDNLELLTLDPKTYQFKFDPLQT